MPLSNRFTALLQRSRALPTPVRYAGTAAIVLAVLLLRRAVDGDAGSSAPLGHYFIAILLSATLFDRGTGFFATLLSALVGTWFHLPPTGSFRVTDAEDFGALALFIVVGLSITGLIEALHRALARVQDAHAELARSERARALMLREFRHRTRNDLGALVGLLMLRARTAPSEVAREALRDAADHALALARVHTRLATEDGIEAGTENAVVDTRDFVCGLCADLDTAQLGQGLRPVAMLAEAESHPLPTERAVPLGLVLNETVTNALKYAFPEDRPGNVRVRFAREGREFVLTVADDGIGLPREAEMEGAAVKTRMNGSGLGTRLLAGLAAQLRGGFTRRAGEGGTGTVAELRFPEAPALR